MGWLRSRVRGVGGDCEVKEFWYLGGVCEVKEFRYLGAVCEVKEFLYFHKGFANLSTNGQ